MMFITEQPLTDTNKFKKMDRQESINAPSNIASNPMTLLQTIRQLEQAVNLESPRTQKAMNTLGFTKFQLMRKNPAEFKMVNEDEAMHQTKYNWHLAELKERLQALIRERKLVKLWMEQRKQMQDQQNGVTIKPVQYSKREPDIEPLGLRDRIGRLERGQQRVVQLIENDTKSAIFSELQKRAMEKDWDTKLERILQKKELMLENKKKQTQEFNVRALKVHKQHKEDEQSVQSQKYLMSETFYDKFEQRDQKIQELRQKSLENIAKRNKHYEERLMQRKLKQMQQEEAIDHVRLSKDQEVHKRLQQSRETMKNQLQQKREEADENMQKVIKNAQMQATFSNLEQINSLWRKLDHTNATMAKKETYIQQFLDEHKKYISERFTKQRKIMEKVKQSEMQQVDEIKDRLQQIDDRMKSFEEQKIIERNVKADLYQQRMIKQNELIAQQQKQKRLREGGILQKSLSTTDKLFQRRQENNKLFQFKHTIRQKQDQIVAKHQQETETFKFTPTSQLLEKFQSLPNIKPEELEYIKKAFQEPKDKDAKTTAHKSQRSSSTQFFKKQQ